MNVKWLWPLPVAALLAGTRVVVPSLRAPIPAVADDFCDYDEAVRLYRFAYAYARENPRVAAQYLRAAERERGRCVEDTKVLAERLRELRTETARILDGDSNIN